jgi:hypothetical protein
VVGLEMGGLVGAAYFFLVRSSNDMSAKMVGMSTAPFCIIAGRRRTEATSEGVVNSETDTPSFSFHFLSPS